MLSVTSWTPSSFVSPSPTAWFWYPTSWPLAWTPPSSSWDKVHAAQDRGAGGLGSQESGLLRGQLVKAGVNAGPVCLGHRLKPQLSPEQQDYISQSPPGPRDEPLADLNSPGLRQPGLSCGLLRLSGGSIGAGPRMGGLHWLSSWH
jgi:hypothetical protein